MHPCAFHAGVMSVFKCHKRTEVLQFCQFMMYIAPHLFSMQDRAYDFLSDHVDLKNADLIYNLFESHLIHSYCTNPKYSQHFHTLHSIHLLGSTILLGWGHKKTTFFCLGSAAFLTLIVKSPYPPIIVERAKRIANDLINTISAGVRDLYNANPKENLTELLNQTTTIPKEDKPNITIRWGCPSNIVVSQCLILARTVLYLSLAYFSINRTHNLVCASLQIYNFVRISQVRWLEFSRTFFIEEQRKKAMQDLQRLVNNNPQPLLQPINPPTIPFVPDPRAFRLNPLPQRIPVFTPRQIDWDLLQRQMQERMDDLSRFGRASDSHTSDSDPTISSDTISHRSDSSSEDSDPEPPDDNNQGNASHNKQGTE